MKLSNEQQHILKIVSHFGCLDIYQAYQLLKPNTIHMSAMLINMLIKNDYIELVNGTVLVSPNAADKYSEETIQCIWVMLKLAKSNDEVFEAMTASAPAKIYFTSDNKNSFELIPINMSKLANVRTIQDKVLSRNKQFKNISNNYTVFVTPDKEIISSIKSYDLQFPFLVALIGDVDKDGIPTIRFLKSIPKKSAD